MILNKFDFMRIKSNKQSHQMQKGKLLYLLSISSLCNKKPHSKRKSRLLSIVGWISLFQMILTLDSFYFPFCWEVLVMLVYRII